MYLLWLFQTSKKRYRCFSLDFNPYIVSADTTFFESSPFFSQSPTYESHRKENDLLAYSINHMFVPHNPTGSSIPITIRPPQHIYSKRVETLDLGHATTASSSENPITIPAPTFDLDLPIIAKTYP